LSQTIRRYAIKETAVTLPSLPKPPRRWRSLACAALAAVCFTGSARAQDADLIAAAKKEGQVVWYTTLIISQLVRPAAAAFEKKYGIKVLFTRANTSETAIKILNESRANNVQVDVFDGTSTVEALQKSGYVLQWIPEAAKRFPAEYRDPENYWVATNLYILTPAFNTSLIPKGSEPRTYQDLLDPKWKGHIAWGATSSSSAGAGFIGTVLKDMGEEKGMAYLQELSKQKITGIGSSAREILDQVIAGEYQIALNIFNNHAVISAKKGAPVEWIPMQPATGTVSAISVHKSAPHPNAAKLLVDFLISKEGQELFKKADYLPADPEVQANDPSLVPGPKTFRAVFFSPDQTSSNMPKWKKVYNDLFR
jgi:ABC-type Fe3+ transport system substrate-binding protein